MKGSFFFNWQSIYCNGKSATDLSDHSQGITSEWESPLQWCFSLFGRGDLSILALLHVLCIPFVSVRSPSPHLPLLHVGASWSRTHSCHAACQYAINPATFHFLWGFENHCCSASGSHRSAPCFFTKRQHKVWGLSYSLSSIHVARSHMRCK